MSLPLRIEYSIAWSQVINQGASYRNVFYIDIHDHLLSICLKVTSSEKCGIILSKLTKEDSGGP